jgi:hypothetical protein
LFRGGSQPGVQIPVPRAVNTHLDHADATRALTQDRAQIRLG